MGANDQVAPRENDATFEIPRIYDDAQHIRAALNGNPNGQRPAEVDPLDAIADAALPAFAVRIYPETGPAINVEWRDMPSATDAIVITEAMLKRLDPART